ncbi:MAG: sarcosine oxidase subunit alpha family protein [Steroidobacterales bacterium]
MTHRPHRLAEGGRIARDKPVGFTLEGRPLSGFAGDTLASALLANGLTLVGRSFKYHRPRGFLAAGVEEPNGLFTLGSGARTTPNVAATVTELHEGLTAQRQNGWPSVDFDLMAFNQLLAPLLGAGFYYKTFMGPRRGSWMFYEPFIRRAAGLGQAVHERDPDRYESRHEFADVLVIGAGPAGLAAARTAGQAGAGVVLVEQDSLPGGQLLSRRTDDTCEPWRCEMQRTLEDLSNVRILLRTTALGLYDGNMAALVTRRAGSLPDPARGEAREVITTLCAKAVVFATGAIERPLVFADNDRPGVMLASAAQTYLNRYAVAIGQHIVVATNNDGAWHSAAELARHGARVTIVDQRGDVDATLQALARQAGLAAQTGSIVTRALGARSVRGARIASVEQRRERTLDCDLLCMSGGWSCSVHLTSHTGIKPRYRADIDSFVPGGFAPGHFGAGAVIGTFSLAGAIREGAAAGADAAGHAGFAAAAASALALPGRSSPNAPFPDAPYRIEPAWPVRTPARGKAFVDFQTDVTARDLAGAHQEGFESVEHLKRYTTLGMGTDQGKTSNINAVGLMADLRGLDMPSTGTTTFRPPYTPVSIGALAGRNIGHHFRPIRRSPLHDWHQQNGAAFIEAGPWLRAWYYRWAGDSAATAYIAEMRVVRQAVGISDVSSLGKIDVQGPDAAEFLNRVYVNGFAKLPVGKARYGVMLNDDATVLDDGTTARFAETRYFLTTTTAQAGEVMSHLEFLLQTAWSGLDVTLVSASDQWAGMSVAGPKARAALEAALPGHDFSDAGLPHMGCRELHIDGVPLRVLRLSFSGELAYELYVPADRGVGLWELLLERASHLGIRPYGLEALASLRIEKGHAAGLELDHRTTLDDLGLGRMASTTKPFVGRELRERADLKDPQRWSLVGIDCLERGARLRGGAILFAAAEPIAGHGRGYITSVTWSTELNRYIALGLYQGGLAHLNEEIVCAYPLKGEAVRARIVSPVFIDAAGERMHV